MFQPKVLNPSPDPFFVRELRKIDPDLRVSWGYNQYLINQWVIERKLPPERYFSAYASLLEADGQRFVQQPIFDTNQPITDEEGNFISYTQVGTRTYDLAPEYEYVLATPELHMGIITELKRCYAWERNHPISRLAFEKQLELQRQEAARKKQMMDALDVNEIVDQVKRDLGIKVQI